MCSFGWEVAISRSRSDSCRAGLRTCFAGLVPRSTGAEDKCEAVLRKRVDKLSDAGCVRGRANEAGCMQRALGLSARVCCLGVLARDETLMVNGEGRGRHEESSLHDRDETLNLALAGLIC